MSFKVKTNVCKHLPSNKDYHSRRTHSQNISCKLTSSGMSGIIQSCDGDALVSRTCGTYNLFCAQQLLTHYWSVATFVVSFKRFWWLILFVFVISSELQYRHTRFLSILGSRANNKIQRSQAATQVYSVIMQETHQNCPVTCQEMAAFYTVGNQVTWKAILMLQIFLIRLYLYTERKGGNWA